MQYIRLCERVADKGKLIQSDKLWENIISNEREYYSSMYYYNDKHFEIFKNTGSIKGITDVTTNKLIFDFDDKNAPINAQNDAKELIKRLQFIGIKDENIEVFFSGRKGFNVSITLNRQMTPELVYSLAVNKYGKGLKTLDSSLYDAVQIVRVPATKHQVSGLYKMFLTVGQLNTMSIDEIKMLATDLDNFPDSWQQIEPISPKEDFFIVPVEKKEIIKKDYKIDITRVPKGWRNCKWSILQGNFESSNRHDALLTLAATCRGMGYDKETAYYNCKSALKKQAARTGQEEFDKEELWKNIIEDSVYKDGWVGGTFTCQKPGWLQKYCQSLDHPCDQHDDSKIVKIEEAFNLFKNYATNIDALTIKTGIPILDSRLTMTVGMSIGIVAPPGVGKTSIALQILNNLSKTGEQALFLSYDMFHALVFQKLIQRHFQMQPIDIFNKFKSGDVEFEKKVMEVIKIEYSNVDFCFKAGQTYSEILDTIKECEEKSGKKVKLIVCDYNELVLTDMSDSTSSSNYVAQKMREIANVQQACVISLFQPNKMSGSPSDEITSYRAAKGGSGIEQSVSVMLGMSRPGYNPRNPSQDKFMTISCLKNRMGSLFAEDFHWDGLTGSLRELYPEEKSELKSIREEKETKVKAADKAWD